MFMWSNELGEFEGFKFSVDTQQKVCLTSYS